MRPSAENHVSWARLIESEILPMADAGVLRWATVAAFYSAMHYVQAYLTENGVVIQDHRQRNNFVAMESRLKEIRANYMRLYDAGWNCRYMGLVPKRDTAEKLINDDLVRVRSHVLPLLPPSVLPSA